MRFITRLLIVVLAIMLVAYYVPGVSVDGFYTALIVALALGVINVTIKPLFVLLTLPLSLLTLGLFVFVINALMFWFVSSIIDGFEVSGFLAAFIGALIVSAVSFVGNKIVS